MTNLEKLKQRLESYKAKMPTHGGTLSAVVCNYMAPTDYTGGALSKGSSGEGQVVWYANTPYEPRGEKREWNQVRKNLDGIEKALGLRVLRESIDCRDYCGFYADSFQIRCLWPLVLILPHSRGFLRGYYEEDAGSLVVLDGVYTDSNACTRAARHYTESLAQDMFRHEEAYQAGSRYESLMQETTEARRDALKLASDMRAVLAQGVKAPESICRALRGDIRAAWHTIRANRKEARALLKEWQTESSSWAYPFYQSFADAAGIKLA